MINQTGDDFVTLPILGPWLVRDKSVQLLALWIRCKSDKKLVEMIKGALPVGILGIGEPLICRSYFLPLGRPFITACIGGGISSVVIGAFGNVGAIAIGPSGVALIPLIANNQWLRICVLGLLAALRRWFCSNVILWDS